MKGEEVTDRFGEKPLHINGLELARNVDPQGGTSVVDRCSATSRRSAAPVASRTSTIRTSAGQSRATSCSRFATTGCSRSTTVIRQVNNLGGGGVPGHEDAWDAILSNGVLLYGIAVDDAHYFKQPGNPDVPGPGAVGSSCARPGSKPARCVDALERGDFYASTGVELRELQVTPGRVHRRGEAEAVLEIPHSVHRQGRSCAV